VFLILLQRTFLLFKDFGTGITLTRSQKMGNMGQLLKTLFTMHLAVDGDEKINQTKYQKNR